MSCSSTYARQDLCFLAASVEACATQPSSPKPSFLRNHFDSASRYNPISLPNISPRLWLQSSHRCRLPSSCCTCPQPSAKMSAFPIRSVRPWSSLQQLVRLVVPAQTLVQRRAWRTITCPCMLGAGRPIVTAARRGHGRESCIPSRTARRVF